MVDIFKKNQLKRKYGSEQVLVIPTQDVQSVDSGFVPLIDKDTESRIWSSQHFVYRYDAEYNLSLIHI